MNKMGFGFLRLPRTNPDDEKSVDMGKACALVDRFMALGGNYFDTAYIYLGGASETSLREALVKRYPRDSFRIADKLPPSRVKEPGDAERIFQTQLERCGVDYFDVFLLHGLNRENYEKCKKFDLFGYIARLKERGLAKMTGFSYHDSPEFLDELLTAHPEVDCVLLQINYLDWESRFLQSRRLYETAVRHGKRVMVMEPVKGGTLAKLPEHIEAGLQKACPGRSMPSWAVRFAQGLENVDVVLSGMNTIEQVEDNMRQVEPLSPAELEKLAWAADELRSTIAIGCTGCAYCEPGCPQGIAIPRYFAMYNEYCRYPKEDWKLEPLYQEISLTRGKASECVGCGACEGSCPQKLPIMETLKKVAEAFENE